MKLIATRDTSGALKLHQVTRKLDTLIDEDGNKLYISTSCLWSDPDYWKDLPGITADMGAVEVEVIIRKKNFLQKKLAVLKDKVNGFFKNRVLWKSIAITLGVLPFVGALMYAMAVSKVFTAIVASCAIIFVIWFMVYVNLKDK